METFARPWASKFACVIDIDVWEVETCEEAGDTEFADLIDDITGALRGESSKLLSMMTLGSSPSSIGSAYESLSSPAPKPVYVEPGVDPRATIFSSRYSGKETKLL